MAYNLESKLTKVYEEKKTTWKTYHSKVTGVDVEYGCVP